MALEKYGTAGRKAVLGRAIGLAEDGFRIDARLAASFEKFTPEFLPFASSVKAFTNNGIPPREGDVLGQPDLARTLSLIRDNGPEGFYRGETARLIVDMTAATASMGVTHGDVKYVGDQQTTHYCVVDRFGNVVSTTVTMNGYYGSKTVVGGAGFLLNIEMDDFVVKPGAPNQFGLFGADANSIAPHKRMLSSMTPTIMLRNDVPALLVGARGGSRISTAVVQVVMNVVDYGMDVAAAVEAPRIHHQWLPDELLYEADGLAQGVIGALTAMGYLVKETSDPNGRCQAIMIDPASGLMYGGPDPREQGVAIGY